MRLELNKIEKRYQGTTVLNIGSLLVEKGELCGVIGENGAGKTTLLKIIAGLDKSYSGNVIYGENRNKGIPYRDMTMVFQSPFLIRTTVEKNIAYPLHLRGWTKEEISKRVEKLANELGLEKFLHRKAWTLSAGEAQKVALARALSFRPTLLLLDEPTANLDPSTMVDLERMLKKSNREEQTTMLLVTHNLGQAKRLCGTIAFLHKGSMIEAGSTEEILTNPKQQLTKRFVEGDLLL